MQELKEIKTDSPRLDLAYEYYNRTDVKFQIIKYTQRREFAYLAPRWVWSEANRRKNGRHFRVHNVHHLDVIMKGKYLLTMHNRFFVNIFASLATYKDGVPYRSLQSVDESFKKWEEKIHEHMESYDLLIDVDSPSHGEEDLTFAKEGTIEIKKIFDQLNVPHYIRFSGCGFHIVVPGKFLPKKSFDPKDKDNIYIYCKKIAKYFFDNMTELVDTSIYDSRRICKIPFTLAHYKRHSYVCLPIESGIALNGFDHQKALLHKFNADLRHYTEKLQNENGNFDKLHKLIFEKDGKKKK